jgi:hypothetical protein
LLKFGKHQDPDKAFLEIKCMAGDPLPSDGVRISGFRLYGPSFESQVVSDTGIRIERCLDVEISNMEIAGWGSAGIGVIDEASNIEGVLGSGNGQLPPDNEPGDRIGRSIPVKIFNNYIHHNQHPSSGGSALGYGVVVGPGAWAQIFQNLFDFNRHAIAATWDTGGYEASLNLVLKGGGYHSTAPIISRPFYTHQFDVHGRGHGNHGMGLDAGTKFLYSQNAFQYTRSYAIHIRGRPLEKIIISSNIFPHKGLYEAGFHMPQDNAIKVHYQEDIDEYHKVVIDRLNVKNFDSYGQYGMCDFDGDQVDDLFLATGVSWWFSSAGKYPWSFLSARSEKLEQVQFGYFDKDTRCDVLTERGKEWMLSSGGSGLPYSIGQFGTPLKDARFGRFDPTKRDQRPGVNKRTTHAFRRGSQGEWQIAPLSNPNGWTTVGGSRFPLNKLRFGDFTGDGVTDVLAVEEDRWAISESASGEWRNLNPYLSNDVSSSSLFIVDLGHNNVDDIIWLGREQRSLPGGIVEETFTWRVSDDGSSRWRVLAKYIWTYPSRIRQLPPVAVVGRFAGPSRGGVLLIDRGRAGHFHPEPEPNSGSNVIYFVY